MKTLEHKIQQIQNRYAIYDRPRNGLSNVLVDSFFPSFLIKSYTNPRLDKEEFPYTFAAISEFASQTMNVPLIPREDLFRMVGYTPKDIKTLLRAVRSKKLNFAMIGMGGTNSNTLYWLKEMCRLTNTPTLFRSLLIYEDDALSLDNIIRMPMSTLTIPTTSNTTEREITPQLILKGMFLKNNVFPRTVDNISSAMSVKDLEELKLEYHYSINNNDNTRRKVSTNDRTHKLHLVTSEYDFLSSGKILKHSQRFNASNPYHYLRGMGYDRRSYYISSYTPYIYYGAPDIATRQACFDRKLPLITATHGDDDISIAINPLQDSMLQRESYGVIKLGVFFMNQIRATIGLLELLASDTDLTLPNQSFLEYSYPRDKKEVGLTRSWNLQIDHDGLLRS